MRLIPVVIAVAFPLCADDRGVPPRHSATDYPVHQATATATIAAALVPARQIEKMFSPDIGRQYVVLEVAIYPQGSFDVDYFDFSLQLGDTVVHVEKPHDVATPWPEKGNTVDGNVHVISETGVIYSRTNDPVNGKRSGVGTYEGVTVTNDPRYGTPPPPPKQSPDPQIVEHRVREKTLPEGGTRTAIAGYLFFPLYGGKHKKGPTELRWSRDKDSVALRMADR